MSEVKGLQHLSGRTYYLRGSPATLFYISEDTVYVIDPGHGSKRGKQLRKIISGLGRDAIAVITHYHSDHLEALSKDIGVSKILSSWKDKPGIEHPDYRISITFGAPIEDWKDALLFRAPSIKVDETIECGEDIGPLQTIHLPGHTPGQIGILTPDGVLYAADAVFGERVLENYLLPYHRDPCKALKSLQKLLNINFKYIVPGHGPILDATNGKELVKKNIQYIRNFLDNVTSKASNGATFNEIMNDLVDNPLKARSLAAYMLVEQSLRGALSCLAARGILEAKLTSSGIVWKTIGSLSL